MAQTSTCLGAREPEHYGEATLADILNGLRLQAEALGVGLTDFQSNAEHELVGKVQDAPLKALILLLSIRQP